MRSQSSSFHKMLSEEFNDKIKFNSYTIFEYECEFFKVTIINIRIYKEVEVSTW